MITKGLTPVPVEAPPPLHVHYLPGRSSRLVVSLAGVGGGKGRKAVPPMEFVRSASAEGENHVLFVSDAARSWMNAPGLANALVALIERTRDKHRITDVLTLGNSMGGFMALVLPQLTEVHHVAAFAPQISMHPQRVPEENRWSNATDKITDWIFEDIGPLTAPGTTYFVLHGGDLPEAHHWLRFPRPKGLHHIIFAETGHGIAASLRKHDLLSPVLAAIQHNRSRVLRRTLQRSKLGTNTEILRREAFEEAYPELLREHIAALSPGSGALPITAKLPE